MTLNWSVVFLVQIPQASLPALSRCHMNTMFTAQSHRQMEDLLIKQCWDISRYTDTRDKEKNILISGIIQVRLV